MKHKYYDKKDGIEPGETLQVRRYSLTVRINHWIGAVLMILLILTGLAMYWPPFFFLTVLFGGGQAVRTLHPWLGVMMVISFAVLFVRMWRLNLPDKSDILWLLRIKDVLGGQEDKLPEVGKYNFGQKGIFWAMALGLIAMAASGVMIWQAWFADWFSIEMQRYAVLVHSLLAVCLIAVLIFHIYAVYWIQGSLTAMVKGKVTGGFSWHHHRKWYRALLRDRKLDKVQK